jgi:hypothetical protein
MQCLGITLSIVTLVGSVQGQNTVTLAWDPDSGGGIAGYRVYDGVASRSYTNAIATGNATSNTISGLASGATYYFAVTAVGTNGLESDYSAEVRYTVPLPTNNPPNISLTSPANGAAYSAPATIPLAASVTANGHTISQVQFYNGATLLGTVAAVPYSFPWNNVSAGTYSLCAKAVYDSGSAVASTAQNVTVTGSITNPPPPLPAVVPAFAQQNYSTPQSPESQIAVAYPKVQTAGNANILAIGWDDTTASISAVSDSAGNLYQAAVPMYRGNGLSQAIYYSAGIKAGSNIVTVTFNQPAAFVDLRVTEYSGLAQVNTLDGSNSGTGTSSSASSGTVTTTTTNELLFGAGYTASALTTAGTGCTSRVVTSPDADIVEDMVASAPGSYAATAAGTAGAWVMQVAAFNAAVVSTNSVTNYAPVITVQPTGTTNSALAGFSVSVTATGTPPLLYQWQLNGTNISGATVSSYSQSPATTNQSGKYTCVVYNNFGSVTSAVAAVLITNAPLPFIALTSPASGAAYAAPAAIPLAASVTANGHTITKVQFYNGATLFAEDASAPYSLVWSNVVAGSYTLTARAVYDSGSTVSSAPVNLTVTSLPAPWQTADLGNVGVAGSAGSSGGLYTVAGAGNISGRADSFRFLYQTLSGDGQIQARVSSVQNTGTAGRIGLMIRESLTGGSEYAFMGIAPNGTFRWQGRTKTGGTTSSTTSGTGTPPNTWARLVRTNGTCYGYKSTDGTNWTLVGSRSISMASSIYVGFAVASGSSTVLNSSTFTSVTVVP